MARSKRPRRSKRSRRSKSPSAHRRSKSGGRRRWSRSGRFRGGEGRYRGPDEARKFLQEAIQRMKEQDKDPVKISVFEEYNKQVLFEPKGSIGYRFSQFRVGNRSEKPQFLVGKIIRLTEEGDMYYILCQRVSVMYDGVWMQVKLEEGIPKDVKDSGFVTIEELKEVSLEAEGEERDASGGK